MSVGLVRVVSVPGETPVLDDAGAAVSAQWWRGAAGHPRRGRRHRRQGGRRPLLSPQLLPWPYDKLLIQYTYTTPSTRLLTP